MKIGIMQPYFFPYIGYWQLINAVDKFVVYDDVNFIKNGWINRNRVLNNGQAMFLNVYMKNSSPNKLINEVSIDDSPKMRLKPLKSLKNIYSKAPYFAYVFPMLEKVFNQDTTNLAKFLEHSIYEVNEYIGINTNICLSSELEKDNSLIGEEKVRAICKELNATEYYNAIGGQELYSKEKFMNDGIELFFIKTKDVYYKQFKNEFVSNLSIIDIMMFNSKEEIKEMLAHYELV